MQAIYTRTMRVTDDGLGKAMEICQGLAKVRKKYYPKHQIYFSFQIGGDPRTIRETTNWYQCLKMTILKLMQKCLQIKNIKTFKNN